jgi:hypothetical protein
MRDDEARDSLIKLSDELKLVQDEDATYAVLQRLAFLHAIHFYSSTDALIQAIKFTDQVCQWASDSRSGAEDDLFAKLTKLLSAAEQARDKLLKFTDTFRTDYDEHMAAQSSLAKR